MPPATPATARLKEYWAHRQDVADALKTVRRPTDRIRHVCHLAHQEVPMKMLINVAETVVADALRGMAAAHPELTVDVENRVIVRRDAPVAGKVGLVSGGGSGHEPLHGGFVGPGMLSAACPGEVFTSPVPDQMVRAAAAVDSGAGVLFIVKNYTGDVLNFDMAAELAEDEGIQIAKVLVNDDVAVTDSLYTAGPPRHRRHAVRGEDRGRGGRGGRSRWSGWRHSPGRSTRTRAVSVSR
jgi:hypothetical protein